jgi:PIN domain nuclease of toxin-antitoxin system
VNYILDAGPMMAFLNNEPGVEVVEDVLTEPGSACYAHVYNLCETYYLYYRRGGAAVADGVIQDLLDIGILARSDVDTAFWKEAGALKAQHALSLPDGFCLALGRRIGATVVTTDHAEFDPLVPLGYCPIRFIR